MNTIGEAALMVFAMGIVILFCRVFPFLFFSKGAEESIKDGAAHPRRNPLLVFVEKTVPPAAMTVLAFNALFASLRDNPSDGILVAAASIFTALLHLWKRNALVSIIGGTVLYMFLLRMVF